MPPPKTADELGDKTLLKQMLTEVAERELGGHINLAIEDSGIEIRRRPAAWQPFPFVYAHGELEERAGFDVLTLRYGQIPLPDTGEPLACRVWIVRERREVEALLFFWTKKESSGTINRGLVVLSSNPEDVAFASRAMQERRANL
jgi:hypothetical protein